MLEPEPIDLPAGAARTADHLRRVRERTETLRQTLREVLPRGRPVQVEIGCGHGHFLTAYAGAHSKEFCVGIDIVRDRIDRATRKRNRSLLPNLFFLLADAHEFMAALPRETRFSAVFVLFPDPWPKRRHHKNRLIQPAFLNAIAGHATKETRFYFRTDFEPYFAEAKRTINSHPSWHCVEEPWPFEMETVFQARAPRYFSLVARTRSERP